MTAQLECRAAAASLRALRPLMLASQIAALVSGLRIGAGESAWHAAPLAVWAFALYLAVRVHLDAELLELLALDPERHPAELDEFLIRSRLRRTPVNRGIHERCQGSLRLACGLVVAVAIQLSLLAFSIAKSAQ